MVFKMFSCTQADSAETVTERAQHGCKYTLRC